MSKQSTMQKIVTRGISLLKPPLGRENTPSSHSRDTLTIIREVRTQTITENIRSLSGYSVQENNENQPASALLDDTSAPVQIDAHYQLQPEKQPHPHTPQAPPPSRSVSMSTQGSSRTAQSGADHLSPPSYSTLDYYDEQHRPGLPTSFGDAGTSSSMGAAERMYGGQKNKRRKDEEEEVEDRAELSRMIGVYLKHRCFDNDLQVTWWRKAHLTATENEDWALVLDMCERASASEANAREAVKALRMEFLLVTLSADFATFSLRNGNLKICGAVSAVRRSTSKPSV